jgi:hypothetical protein
MTSGGELAPAPVLELAALVLTEHRASAPLAVLDADGTLHHAACTLALHADGTVTRDGALLLALRDGALLDAAGQPAFTLDGARLLRAEGRAVTIEEGRVLFEGSPELVLRVDGASSEALVRTTLVVVAALSTCEG